MKSYCIYKHTSPSGKVYIGATSQRPAKRWGGGSGYVSNPYFAQDIQKYGWAAFTHEILASGLTKAEAGAEEARFTFGSTAAPSVPSAITSTSAVTPRAGYRQKPVPR